MSVFSISSINFHSKSKQTAKKNSTKKRALKVLVFVVCRIFFLSIRFVMKKLWLSCVSFIVVHRRRFFKRQAYTPYVKRKKSTKKRTLACPFLLFINAVLSIRFVMKKLWLSCVSVLGCTVARQTERFRANSYLSPTHTARLLFLDHNPIKELNCLFESFINCHKAILMLD